MAKNKRREKVVKLCDAIQKNAAFINGKKSVSYSINKDMLYSNSMFTNADGVFDESRFIVYCMCMSSSYAKKGRRDDAVLFRNLADSYIKRHDIPAETILNTALGAILNLY